MREKLRSLRVRVTLLATLAVAIALVTAAMGLVASIERTLLGRSRRAAVAEMKRVADAVAEGRDIHTETAPPFEVVVQVLDQDGNVVDARPPLVAAPRPAEGSILPHTQIVIRNQPGVDDAGTPVIRQLDQEELILAQTTVDSPDGERTVVAISPFGEVARSVDTVVTALWVGTPFLIGFVGLTAWYFTGRTLRPVDAMTRRAAAVSHSTLEERLPRPGTHDEIDRLATTLNSMLERLEEASRREREFVSDASHELRSPITAIKTQLEVALVHPDSSPWPDVAKDALREADRMERIVGDLLALAHTEESAPKRQPLDLKELVIEEVERTRDDRIRTTLTPVVVGADEDQLRRAVTNLLDNARRYAREAVEVSVQRIGDDVVVAVDDDGPGVPVQERSRIFERFARVDEGRARDHGGIGIGLALVRSIATAHAGGVTCAESALGGARFEIRLPLRDSPGRAPASERLVDRGMTR